MGKRNIIDRERVRYLNLGGLSENHKTKIGEARKEYLILHPEEMELFRLANLEKHNTLEQNIKIRLSNLGKY